eukprot:TRINITY_DN10126_c0_g1_i2.p1 TRINITY_DN10126_c0_g1~~TRINITY_DN10126_c0_g1_i2.p1  ORF type:complete len:607 (-),score=119.42 TRINITY_DN10126_c0_g1_i2:53-1873(-)
MWVWLVLIGLLIYFFRPRYEVPWNINEERGYNLASLKAPVLTGWQLRAFANILESPLFRWMLLPKLIRDSGFSRLKSVRLDEAPTLLPAHPHPASPDFSTVFQPLSRPDLEQLSLTAPSPLHPTDQEFSFPKISDYFEAYRSGRVSPVTVAQRFIRAVHQSNTMRPPLRSIIFVEEEKLMEAAKASAARYKEGRWLSVLDGVPISVKDELDVKGYRTCVGTAFLGQAPAQFDAEVVARLRECGALIVGKSNMFEIGMGVSGANVNPEHGVARNPYNTAYDTSGSSSGAGSSVAAGLCPVSLGCDGGGSIRLPASFCGVVGLKPTFARVSEHGAAPLCWSVAHAGPLAGCVRDAAVVYGVIAGPDIKNPPSLIQPSLGLLHSVYPANQPSDLRGIRIGVDWSWFRHGDTPVVRTCELMLHRFVAECGAELREIHMQNLEVYRLAHTATIASEMYTNMSPYMRDHSRTFNPATRLSLQAASWMGSDLYIKSQCVRTHAIHQVDDLLKQVDVIITPAAACLPPRYPDNIDEAGASNLELTSHIMRFAFLANLTGHPAITFPVGYYNELPVSMQVMAGAWREDMCLRVAEAAEVLLHKAKPRVFFDLLQQ